MAIFSISVQPTVSVIAPIDGHKSFIKFTNFGNGPKIDFWGNAYDVGMQYYQTPSLSSISNAAAYNVSTTVNRNYFVSRDEFNGDFTEPCIQVVNKTGTKLYQTFGESIADNVVQRIIQLGYVSTSAEKFWYKSPNPNKNVLAASIGNRNLWTTNGTFAPFFSVLKGGRYAVYTQANGNSGERSTDPITSVGQPRLYKLNTILLDLKETTKPSIVGYCYFYSFYNENLVIFDTPDVSVSNNSRIYLIGSSDLNGDNLGNIRNNSHWAAIQLPTVSEFRSGNYNRLWNTVVSSKHKTFEIPSYELRYGSSINSGNQFFRNNSGPGPLLFESGTGFVYNYFMLNTPEIKTLASVTYTTPNWLKQNLSGVSVQNRMYRIRLVGLESTSSMLPTNATYVTAQNTSLVFNTNFQLTSSFYSVVSSFGSNWTDTSLTLYQNNNDLTLPDLSDRWYGDSYFSFPTFFRYSSGKYILGFKKIAKASWLNSGAIGTAFFGQYSPTERAVTTIVVTSAGVFQFGTDYFSGTSANISMYRFIEIDATNLNNVSVINSVPVTIRHLRNEVPDIATSITGWLTSSSSRRWSGGHTTYITNSELFFDSLSEKVYVTDFLRTGFTPATELLTTSISGTSVFYDGFTGDRIGTNFYNSMLKYSFGVNAAVSTVVNRLRRIFTLSTD